MTPDDIRKSIANNQLQQALALCDQLALPDDFKSRLVGIKASFREYNNHIIDGDMRHDDLEIMRAQITKKLLVFLSEYEIVCLKDFKTNFIAFTEIIQQNATDVNKATVIEEAKQISADLQTIDIAEKKDDVKPDVIERVGNFLAKFKDKNSTQSKVLSTIKDGVSMLQNLGRKYNSIAQWFMLPHIPDILL